MLASFCFAVSLLLLAPPLARGQEENAHVLVKRVVRGELAADARDHSRWIFRDADKGPDTNTVKLVVQTPQGNLSKTIEIDGHPLTAQQEKDDEQKMHQFVTDPVVRQKQKLNQEQDGEKARSLTRILPSAFLWTKTEQHGAEATLAFRPNPSFNPPTREARVFAAMEGTMVVNTRQLRIVALRGRLIHNVDFGFGVLGKLQKGGTFDVERSQIGPKVWEVTAMHVHIQGHALIFKSIREQQDEETSGYKPAPRHITLAAAARMLDNGTVAKELGEN